MLKRINKDNSGVVLVTVIITTMVMVVLTIGILSLNVSQVYSGQAQIEDIRKRLLVEGAHWLNYSSIFHTTVPYQSFNETVDGKIYAVTISRPGYAGSMSDPVAPLAGVPEPFAYTVAQQE